MVPVCFGVYFKDVSYQKNSASFLMWLEPSSYFTIMILNLLKNDDIMNITHIIENGLRFTYKCNIPTIMFHKGGEVIQKSTTYTVSG